MDKVLAEVLAAIRDAQAQGKSRETALAVTKARILPHIDFELMTRLAMGRVWKTASVSQRKDLVAEFGTLITRTYSFAIDAYQGQRAIVEPLQIGPADVDVTVRTRFEKGAAQPVQVDYAMRKSPDGWKVYDIVVEHVSLVITYRSQFSEEVQRTGVDGLIQTLADKNRQISNAR
ncbi:MAG: phospholipid-binding protein MlaC [Burkholderiales bacterium]